MYISNGLWKYDKIKSMDHQYCKDDADWWPLYKHIVICLRALIIWNFGGMIRMQPSPIIRKDGVETSVEGKESM